MQDIKKIIDEDKMLYIRCACHTPEHHFILHDGPDYNGDYEPWVYLETHLFNYLPWYKRIWPAIRYIFGYKSRYGNFDSINIGEKDMVKIRDFFDEAIKIRKENKNDIKL